VFDSLEPMSTLRSGIDELATEDLAFASDDELEASLVEIERAMGALVAERARRVAEVERRGAFARDGLLSLTMWLVHRLRIAGSCAGRYVRWARALERMPLTRSALAAGDVTPSAAAVLVAAAESRPDEFPGVEETLVEAARSVPVRDLRRLVAYWRQAADAAGAEDEAEWRHGLRRLHVSPTLEGMVRVDGDLDPETGQTLITALRAVIDADVGSTGDLRTYAQRRADALGEICRRYLDSVDRPIVAGERPHLTVTVDLETLEGRTGRRCELDEAGVITPEAARRLACDASVARIVTAGRSEPLDAGRRTPVVSPALRRALVIRDGGCRFPGCGRPPGWCDAHHVVHWADGGRTALSNLVLLCRPHHRAVHRLFGVRMVSGRPEFLRPDGSALEDRGPP